MKRYGFAWITGAFFLLSLAGHWIFGWLAYLSEQQAHHEAVQVTDYLIQMGRDTLENWQSEFLQLLWQVGGLAMLLYVGSPQSKEGTERLEAKLDALLRLADEKNGKNLIAGIDRQFLRDEVPYKK